jgi:hypothetical protein
MLPPRIGIEAVQAAMGEYADEEQTLTRRAGASWDRLQGAINLCFLFRGLPAANRGAEVLANLAKRQGGAKAV